MGDFILLLALPAAILLAVLLHRKELAKKGRPPTDEEIKRWQDEQW